MANVYIEAETMSAIGESIRTKGGTTAKLLPADMPKAITDIKGTELNIAYGNAPPADTSKLWCKCAEPNKVVATNKISDGTNNCNAISTVLPVAITGACCATVGDDIYIFGGVAQDTIYKFNAKTATIALLSKLPQVLDSACCSTVGHNIYVIGGVGLDTIYKFNTDTNQIENSKGDLTTQPIARLPESLYQLRSCSVGQKIYIIGGVRLSGDEEQNTIYKFDTVTNQIVDTNGNITTQPITRLPKGIGRTCVNRIGKSIYVIGGTSYKKISQNTIYKYDLNKETESPKLVATLPKPVAYACCSSFGNKIFVFGGRDDSNNKLKNIYVYDVYDNWAKLVVDAELPQVTENSCCDSFRNKAYIFGGHNGSSSVNQIVEFDILVSLTKNNLLIEQGKGVNYFNIINTTDMQIGSPLDSVYLGNAQNEAEPVEAYLHNGTDWELI